MCEISITGSFVIFALTTMVTLTDLTLAISRPQTIMVTHPQQLSCARSKKFKKRSKNHEIGQALARLKYIVAKKPSDRMY